MFIIIIAYLSVWMISIWNVYRKKHILMISYGVLIYMMEKWSSPVILKTQETYLWEFDSTKEI